MTLANLDIEELRRKVTSAYENDRPLLERKGSVITHDNS